MIDNPADLRAELVDLKRRIRELETAAVLHNASITSGPGVLVKVASGVTFDGTGSAVAGAASLDAASGGSVGAGGTRIRDDGSLWNAGNALQVASNTDFAGNVTAQGAVRGHLGVIAPLNGAMSQLGPAIESAQSTASSAASAASAAQSTANSAQSAANAAQSTANNAKSTADGIKAGTVPLQSPNLIAPKVTGLTSGTTGGEWSVLLVNTSTGVLRFLNQA